MKQIMTNIHEWKTWYTFTFSNCSCCITILTGLFSYLIVLQLNLHVTDLSFQYLSHHLTWHYSSTSYSLNRFVRNLQHMSPKFFFYCFWTLLQVARLKLFRNNKKTILRSNAANFLQIWANLQKSWNNMMSNDGLVIQNIHLSHIHLAVTKWI